MSGKDVGSNSSSLVMPEGLSCSMGVNPHGHLQVLLLRRDPAAGFAQEGGWRPESMLPAWGLEMKLLT